MQFVVMLEKAGDAAEVDRGARIRPAQARGMSYVNGLTTTCAYLRFTYPHLWLRAIGLAFLIWGRLWRHPRCAALSKEGGQSCEGQFLRH